MACTIADAHSLPSMIVINISALSINNDTTYYGVLNKTGHEYLRLHNQVILLANSSINDNKNCPYFHI